MRKSLRDQFCERISSVTSLTRHALESSVLDMGAVDGSGGLEKSKFESRSDRGVHKNPEFF